MIIYFSH